MTIPISLIVAHYIGDWLLQFEWMANSKSKSNYALFCHTAALSVVLFIWATWYIGVGDGAVAFVFINWAFHFSTDWYTSRVTGRLWPLAKVIGTPLGVDTGMWVETNLSSRPFFNMIGFDQVLHYIMYAILLNLVGK